MEQSPEIKAVMLRLYETMSTGDIASLDRIFSNRPDVLLIGTDPKEWWTDPAIVKPLLKEQAQAGIKVVPGDLLTWREGTVGWAADQTKFVLADGTEVQARSTAIFHQEAGEWKMIHLHTSFGVPNVEALGLDV